MTIHEYFYNSILHTYNQALHEMKIIRSPEEEEEENQIFQNILQDRGGVMAQIITHHIL
jgi:hypothetical protein